MDWPTLIDTLKQIMQDDDISAQALSSELGVSISSVRNYLSKRQRASISTREKIEQFVADHSKKSGNKRNQNKKSNGQKAAKPAAKRQTKQNEAKQDQPKRRPGRPRKQPNSETAQAKPEQSQQNSKRQTRSQRNNRQQSSQSQSVNNSQSAKYSESTTQSASQSVSAQSVAQQTVKPQQQQHTPVASRSKTPVAQKPKSSAVRIYVDESFGQSEEKPFTVGMVLCSTTPGIMPFKEFTQTLYPFGWAPGDEVKAQGKDLANVKYVIEGSVNDDIRMFAFHTKMVPPLLAVSDDDSTMVSIFPYVSGLVTAIEQMQHQGLKGTQFQIIIDRTNKLPTEALRVMQNMLDVYFRLASAEPLSFHITDGDSRAQKGLQLADFVAHYAYVEDAKKTADFSAVTTILDDELGNARRFAYYSGLRLITLKPGAQTLIQRDEPAADFDGVEDEDDTDDADDETPITGNMSRAMELVVAFKGTITKAAEAGLSGKQLENVRSRLKGLSTTVVNWLNDSQATILNGLANRTIADFRERMSILTRIDSPFKSTEEIGEQQFHIFETQLEKIVDLLDSYSTTAESN